MSEERAAMGMWTGRLIPDIVTAAFEAEDISEAQKLILAAIDAAGWAVLPKEPTEEMRDAGEEVSPIAFGTEAHRMSGGVYPEDYYRAMLAAAPKPE